VLGFASRVKPFPLCGLLCLTIRISSHHHHITRTNKYRHTVIHAKGKYENTEYKNGQLYIRTDILTYQTTHVQIEILQSSLSLAFLQFLLDFPWKPLFQEQHHGVIQIGCKRSLLSAFARPLGSVMAQRRENTDLQWPA
jgi:hypothetical protein